MIRNDVGDKLPDGIICRSRDAQGPLQNIERKAETILWSLAKNLATLKENFAIMSDNDIRQFLQVSVHGYVLAPPPFHLTFHMVRQDLRCKIVPDSDENVIEMMKTLLQTDHGD